MTSIGLRDQLIPVFAPQNQGSDGVVSVTYVQTGEWWGRIDEGGAQVKALQERLQTKLDAIADFALEAVIPANGVLLDPDTGLAWWIRGVYAIRTLRVIRVGLDRIADELFATFQMYDGASKLDGTHLVTPAPAPTDDEED